MLYFYGLLHTYVEIFKKYLKEKECKKTDQAYFNLKNVKREKNFKIDEGQPIVI